MSVSVTSVVIQAKSDGITQAASDLDKLTQAAGNTEAATTSLGKSTKTLGNAYAEGVAAGEKLLAQMQKQVDLLGANVSQTNAYNASMKGASQAQVQQALALGAQVDAYKRLSADQSEAIRMNNQLIQGEAQKAASGAAFIKSLTEQATRLSLTGDALKAYNISLIQAQANALGVSSAAAPLIESLNKTGVSAQGAHGGMAGITRELIVLTHEMSQGQFSRFGGSMLVLAERINFVPTVIETAQTAMSKWSLSLGGLIGIAAALAVAIGAVVLVMIDLWKSASQYKELTNALILTNNYAGATADSLLAMAASATEAGGSIGHAKDTVLELAASGKFTAEQIGFITDAAIALERATGVSTKETIKHFEELATQSTSSTSRSTDAIAKDALKLSDHYHYLTADIYAQIVAFEKEGDAHAAIAVSLKAYSDSVEHEAAKIEANLSDTVKVLHTLRDAASAAWDAIGRKETAQTQIAALQYQMKQFDAQGGGAQYATVDQAYEYKKQTLAKIAELQKQVDAQAVADKAKSDAVMLEQEKIHGQARLNSLTDQYDKQKKAIKDLAQFDRDYEIQSDAYKTAHATEYAETRVKLEEKTHEKLKKVRAEGTSGIDATVKDLEAQSSAITVGYNNQLSLLDQLHKGKLISDEVYTKAANETLANQYKNTQDYYNKELAALQTYESAAKRTTSERNIAEGKISELTKLKSKALADYAAQQQNTALVEAIANQKQMDDERDKTEKMVKSTQTATDLINAQIDAYNNLPKAIKDAGITAKQMEDSVTQAKMDALQSEADLLAKNGMQETEYNKQRIKEINDLITANTRLRNAQTTKEGNEKVNTFNLGSGARSKEAAAQAVNDWKDAGKEIESALSDSFGAAGKTMGTFFKAFTDGLAAQTKAQEDYNKVKEQYKDAPEAEKTLALTKAQAKLDSDRFNNQMKGYADIASGAKGFFKENSTGYKLLDGLEKTFHLLQLANQAEKLVTSLAVSTASATGVVAGQAVETSAVVAGQAVQNTAKIPGVFMSFMSAMGPWGAAAAAVAIAAVLGGAFSGGGSSVSVSEQRQKTQGTGSVLGDSTEVSQSIKNSLENIDKTSGLGLAHSASMDVSLKAVVAGISGLSTLLVGGTNITSLASSVAATSSGGFFGNIISSIFGGKTTVDDTGFTIGKTSVGAAATSGVKSSSYVDTTKSGGWFSSDSHKTATAALGAEVDDQFTKIINGLADTVNQAATQLGLGGDAFTEHLKTFVVDIGKISLKGMSGTEIQTALEGVFSKLGDDMAKFGVAGLAQYQKVGEGYLETLTRVANDYMQVSDVLAVLGKSFNAVGLQAVDLSEGLIAAAGDLETLTTNTQYFVTNFLTEAERMKPITASVNAELTRLGVSTNLTMDQFKNLVLAQDLNTASGQAMYAALLNLAPAFKESADYAVALADGTVDLTDAQQKALDKVTKARSALDDAYSTQSDALTSAIDKLNTFKDGLVAFQSSLLTGSSSPLTAAQKYAQTLANFNTVSAAAKGGDATAQAAFQGAANDLLTASKAYNASSQAYTDDFNNVLSMTKQLADATTSQIDTAQATLDALDKQVAGLTTVNASVLTVTQAIEALQAAITGGTAAGLTDAQMGVVAVDGSHANGLAYVPKDNYKANLHKGERVLTAAENANYGKSDNSEMIAEMKDMKVQLTDALQQLAAATVDSNYKSNMMASDAIVAGVDESLQKNASKDKTTIKVN